MEKALRAMAVPDAGEKIYETLRERLSARKQTKETNCA